MKNNFHKTLLASAFLLASVATQAQMKVDIGLYGNGRDLEVRLRPTESFTGIVSSVVFTIRWEANSGGAINAMEQARNANLYLPTKTSGGLHQYGSYQYQVYAGFGMDQMEDLGISWEAGKEYTIATIPVISGAEYELVNDGWTGQQENNGDYYLSLGGYDRTGIIYKGMAKVDAPPAFAITPNPSNGIFNMVIPVRNGEDTYYEVLNTAGQVVLKRQVNAEDGSYREHMDLSRFGAGTYNLRIFRDGNAETHKVVIN